MEIILAIVVASAVIFFGALISMGNERQKNAIEDLREQLSHWAIQDLLIKRERLAHDVRVDDPIGWFNEQTEKVTGYKVNLQVIEKSDEPQAFLCEKQESATKILYCFNSPKEIERFRKGRRNKLDRINDHLFTRIPTKYEIYEATILNNGLLFDKELAIAWQGITGHLLRNEQKLWIYVFDHHK